MGLVSIKLQKFILHASKEGLCTLVKESSTLNDANFLKLKEKYCDPYAFCMHGSKRAHTQ